MSQQLEVGSVLGGRYKVTGSVLLSHDQDQVLDGVDQVLNRPVSILVASTQNAEQLSLSAREVATGERPGSMQVLDLGVTDGLTYLITSHSSAPDLLDLLVATDGPYVEPFFTETLGSEIFGEARSTEPETYGGRYDDAEGEFIDYASQEDAPASPAGPVTRPTPAARQEPATPATAPVQRAVEPSAPVEPVRGPANPPQDRSFPAPATEAFAEPAVSAADADEDRRQASHFPAGARNQVLGFDTEVDDEETPATENRSTRWIVGGVLVAVLVAALVFAVINLSGISAPSGPKAGKTTSVASGNPSEGTPSQEPSAPVAAPPVIDSLTRLGTFDFAAEFDKDLPKAIDGNNATYWSNMEFGSDNWGGATKDVALAVKLKEPAAIKSITLNQLGGSGGSLTVYTNDKPSLDGAKQVASNSFTGPSLTMAVSGDVTAQYVIIDITALPRLAAPRTQYPYGLRLSEIKIQ
ncbi:MULTISPECIES: ABC transporter substrate-binding protein [Arthrobacter]|uniref:ABC transporter substrate-binding protein n=2 Tax=Arthrobacter TaxID=1663 RepID=A0ABU9KJD3_9MICC|nr:ABC transporter substrate-binding protein [Arthrobacter sp. YJM1]MDP5226860.1 ABC transporter substrate-binding protein [Arthrobacter sp. YJM1]